MLLPSRLARRRGPVAEVLGAGAKLRARAAASLASATDEDLVALVKDADASRRSLDEASNSASRSEQWLSVRTIGEPSVEGPLRALMGVGERLVMLDRRFVRDAEWQAVTELSEALGVPLLFD